jgi:hypothetical protein
MPVPSDLTLSQLAFLRATGRGAWGVKASTTTADVRTIGSLLNRGLIELHKPAPLLAGPSADPHPDGHWQPTLKALRSPVWPNQPHSLA